jgi:hypothetical protein
MGKIWKKPELIVLFKGKPGEAVLCHCKTPSAHPGAPGQTDCYAYPKCKDNEGQS